MTTNEKKQIYKVFGVYSATGPQIEVEADSAVDAVSKATEEGTVDSASLCHQCVNELYLEDPFKYVVTLPNGKEVDVLA